MTMTPFSTLTGIAAPLIEDNIDTDVIYPARFLLITAREGLGAYAFHDRMVDAEGARVDDFIFNREPWDTASILIAGANFGSGSSREQAVWALLGRGIRCVIAPSFGEIFYANCFRNGVLPIRLSPDQIGILAERARCVAQIKIDLPAQQICASGIAPIPFDIAPDRKQALLNGWDETAILLNNFGDAIAAFETRQQAEQPWLYQERPEESFNS